MMGHTPGPWPTPEFGRRGNPCWSVGKESPSIAAVMKEGDAYLIAAAPDLLEASRLALQVAEAYIHDQLDGTPGLDGALAQLAPVRAAIAKATGETA